MTSPKESTNSLELYIKRRVESSLETSRVTPNISKDVLEHSQYFQCLLNILYLGYSNCWMYDKSCDPRHFSPQPRSMKRGGVLICSPTPRSRSLQGPFRAFLVLLVPFKYLVPFFSQLRAITKVHQGHDKASQGLQLEGKADPTFKEEDRVLHRSLDRRDFPQIQDIQLQSNGP